MGIYHKPINNKKGFVILNRWNGVHSNILYSDEQSARDVLTGQGFQEGQTFKIVPAHFELDTAEIVPEKV